MDFLISFLEGIASFVSPCLLPMLPIYISYFAGQNNDNKKKTLFNALGFVLGFTIVFVLLGALAGTFGKFINDYINIFNIIFGIIIVLFGLNFIGIVTIPAINKTKKLNIQMHDLGFFSSLLFGIIFSIGWTPCIGAFLGSALMMVASSGQFVYGLLMLLCFSLGLGIPFIISAVLIDKLKSAFDFIKKHYKVINIICGLFLIIIGILMAFGVLNIFLRSFI